MASDPKPAPTAPFLKDNGNRNYMTPANEIIEACKAKDRAAIKRLIEAVRRDEWVVEPGLATVRLTPATVRVWHLSGGSGINVFVRASPSFMWDEEVLSFMNDDIEISWPVCTEEPCRVGGDR